MITIIIDNMHILSQKFKTTIVIIIVIIHHIAIYCHCNAIDDPINQPFRPKHPALETPAAVAAPAPSLPPSPPAGPAARGGSAWCDWRGPKDQCLSDSRAGYDDEKSSAYCLVIDV